MIAHPRTREMALIGLLSCALALAGAFELAPLARDAPASGRRASRRAVAPRADASHDDLLDTLDVWGPGQAVDAGRDLLQVLDVWDEDQDGDAEQCMLGPPEAGFDCCMIGPEPLTELCDRLDVPSATAALSRLFTQVMGESGGECVTVEMMRKKIRAKLEKRPSPNAVIFPEAEGA